MEGVTSFNPQLHPPIGAYSLSDIVEWILIECRDLKAVRRKVISQVMRVYIRVCIQLLGPVHPKVANYIGQIPSAVCIPMFDVQH
jgi:hypothetical protein